MGRVLGRVRLSRDTEVSSSVDRQHESIRAWAQLHGHTVVGFAEDVDVSGSLSPFDTPQFGAWLADPDTWDIAVAWKLDRFGRTSFGLSRLFQWALENDKTLATVEDSIDLGTWSGRLVASVLAGVAEGELEAIRDRTRASQAHLRNLGRWHGGQVPFGYQAVPRDDGGYGWEPVEKEAELVREMADMAIQGYSIPDIMKWLSSVGAKPRRADHWTQPSVSRLLRSRVILGQATHRGRVILDDDGSPVQYGPPLIPEYLWERVQQALDTRTKVKTFNNDVGLLKDVGFCAECGSKLYLWVSHARGRKTRYWRCAGKTKKTNDCQAPNIPADMLETSVSESFLSILGEDEASDPVYDPGSTNTQDLDRVDKALDLIRREADAGLYEGEEDAYLQRVKRLTEQKRALESKEPRPAQWTRKGLGVTYGELWNQAESDASRRELLIKAGFVVTARVKPFTLNVHVDTNKIQELVPGYFENKAASDGL